MTWSPPAQPRCAGVAAPLNAFTVDLEEWFHVCGVGAALAEEQWDRLPSRVDVTTRWLLDTLHRAGVTATFFVVGRIAERYPRLLEDVRAAGHEIGSHGHRHRRVYEMTPDEFRHDLRASVAALQISAPAPVTMFRAPEWSITERSLWALDILAQEGFRIDGSMAPLRLVGSVSWPRHPYVRQTAFGSIIEAPPLVADRFGHVMPMGWGWGLRMSSPRRVLRTIEGVNRAGVPAVLTVHPWEFDPDPPRLRLPLRLRFAHYFRLRGFRERVREVLAGAPFGPLGRSASLAIGSRA